MKIKNILLLGALLAGSAFATAVTGVTCPSASLSQYVSSFPGPGSACTVGPVGFYGFSYSPVDPASGSSLDNQAANILVGPMAGGLSISSPFSSSADLPADLIPKLGSGISWRIRYSEDPAPVLTGEDLTLDPPAGLVKITETICIIRNTGPEPESGCENVLPGDTFVMMVTPGSPTASVTYPQPVSHVDITLLFELSGAFSDFGGSVGAPILIPEPGTAGFAAFGVIALFGLRRLRK